MINAKRNQGHKGTYNKYKQEILRYGRAEYKPAWQATVAYENFAV
jgi:hypothetical protein